jgi:lipopolysaccharide export LptBFGC system permease protein LptF
MSFVSFAAFGLIFLFDFAEVTRKFPISNLKEILFAINLSLMRVPITFCEISGYIYLITATFSLWNLCNSHQMTVLKSVGKSPQQILFPFIIFATFLSLFWLFLIHPLSNIFYEKYNESAGHFGRNISENVWMDYPNENKIFFIRKMVGSSIDGLHIFDQWKNLKIFAKRAEFSGEALELEDITIINYDSNPITKKSDKIIVTDTFLSIVKILSKHPESHAIYQLCKLYKIPPQNRVSLRMYEFAFHKLLSNCLNFLIFALIAAVICFPINRYKTKTNVAIKIIIFSIMLRFLNNVCDALANTGALSIIAAAWSTSISIMCILIAILICKEV